MSGNNAANVAVAKPKVGGAIFVAPAGTPVPTDATSSLSDEFECVGFISENGFVNTPSRSSKDYPAWGGDTVISAQESYTETVKFKMIETRAESMRIVFGDENVKDDPTSGLTVLHKADELEEHAYVIETVLGRRIKRQTIPRAKVNETGDISSSGTEILGYEVTLGLLPDANETYSYEYITAISEASEAPEQDAKAIDDMNVAELKAYALTHDIDLGDASLKADILDAIKAAEGIADSDQGGE